MKIKSIHVGLVIVVVLLVSLAAFATQLKPVSNLTGLPDYASGCFFSSSIQNPEPSSCNASLSITSGSPGTEVTVTASNFLDIQYVDDGVVYLTPAYQNVPEYSVYFQQVSATLPTDLQVTSGSLSCSTVYCTAASPTVTFMSTGSLSAIFTVPQISPGTYNVVVTVAYTTPTGFDYAESAIATFTVT